MQQRGCPAEPWIWHANLRKGCVKRRDGRVFKVVEFSHKINDGHFGKSQLAESGGGPEEVGKPLVSKPDSCQTRGFKRFPTVKEPVDEVRHELRIPISK